MRRIACRPCIRPSAAIVRSRATRRRTRITGPCFRHARLQVMKWPWPGYFVPRSVRSKSTMNSWPRLGVVTAPSLEQRRTVLRGRRQPKVPNVEPAHDREYGRLRAWNERLKARQVELAWESTRLVYRAQAARARAQSIVRWVSETRRGLGSG